MEFPRKATQKNVEDFNLKNPDIKEMINKVVNNYFMTDDLIIDKEGLPYDKIIKDFVRNYEIVSESDILKYLLDITENKNRLYRINIESKTNYYIRKLQIVTNEILEELNTDTSGKEIKLSDRIDLNSDMITAICKFVKQYFDSNKFNPYDNCIEIISDETHLLLLGKFIRKFIDQNNLIWEDQGIHLYKPKHININFHCYGFAENSDVLFTKEEHDFSFSTMKYDFEDGYSPDLNTVNQKTNTNIINKKTNTGCILSIISLGFLLGTIIALSF